MNAKRWVQAMLATGVFVAGAPAALAYTMSVEWTNPAGDGRPVGGPVGNVSFARLSFDAAGAWTAYWRADPLHPFTGNAVFDLNLFDTALGTAVGATAPQVSLDGFRNFGTSTATEFSYSGNTPYLANWHVGDTVVTGNVTNFMSTAVSMDSPWGRDDLLARATITTAVPEPANYGLLLAGLGVLAVVARRRKDGP